jgi:hypothetical protein
MFHMKGNLILPSIVGVVAVVLGAVVLISPNRSHDGNWIWDTIAGLFGIYVLCGVVVSHMSRNK